MDEVQVGARWVGGLREDRLDPGPLPTKENCQISRWELGTINYEALAGLEACVAHLASLAGEAGAGQDHRIALARSYAALQAHEAELSARFLSKLRPLQEEGLLTVFGPASAAGRTPTFALALVDGAGAGRPCLAEQLSSAGALCTHGNHYAVDLVEERLGQQDGVTRVSFLHYNTLQEVDMVADLVAKACYN